MSSGVIYTSSTHIPAHRKEAVIARGNHGVTVINPNSG